MSETDYARPPLPLRPTSKGNCLRERKWGWDRMRAIIESLGIRDKVMFAKRLLSHTTRGERHNRGKRGQERQADFLAFGSNAKKKRRIAMSRPKLCA